MIRAYRLCAAAILWGALILQFVLFQTDPAKTSAISATVSFFSYFTILSNLIGAVVMSATAFGGSSRIAAIAASPESRTAAALYLAVVSVVYHAILAPLWNPQGLQLATDVVLHTLAPLILAGEWLFFTPKRGVRFSSVPLWLVVPLAYGVYSLARGAVAGVYPYFFLNAAELGYTQVLLNFSGLLAVFAAAGAGMVVLGRRMPQPFLVQA